MPLHPDARRFLDRSFRTAPLDTKTPKENRADMARALPLTGEALPVHDVTDTTIAGVPVRVHVPFATDEPLPCVVYLHGGGWVMGSVDIADATVREIAVESGAITVSVGYRLAPEHPFPAALDDALAVTRALLDGRTDLLVDAARVAVAGSSAGGNLAAVVAQQLRGHVPDLRHQVLVYPVTDIAEMTTGSYRRFGEGHYLTARDMAYYADQYAPGTDRTDPRLSPLRNEDLSGLPPATIVLAECDPLTDEGRAYAQALLAAGNEVSTVEFVGQVHPFVYLGGIIGDAHVARQLIGRRLKAAFLRP